MNNKTHLTFIYSLLLLCWALLIYLLVDRPTDSNSFLASFYDSGMEEYSDTTRVFKLPDSLSFAGELVPLDIPDVRERLDREIHVNAYWQSNMILLMKRSTKYLPEIERLLQENGIPDDFKYLAIAESALMNVTSPAGARGFWQFMRDTGREYGLEISPDVDERYHLQKATHSASKYLTKSHEKFGNWTSVAASYNMGQTGFAKRQNQQLTSSYYDLYLNEETSRYMFRILAFKVIFENPKKYGFFLEEDDYYQMPEFKELRVDKDIKDLATWARQNGSDYKNLKLYNPWLRDRNLKVRKGKSYQVLLPADT